MIGVRLVEAVHGEPPPQTDMFLVRSSLTIYLVVSQKAASPEENEKCIKQQPSGRNVRISALFKSVLGVMLVLAYRYEKLAVSNSWDPGH